MKRYPEYKESGVEFIGEIPAHWEAKRLGQVSTIFKGGTPKRNVDRYFQGDLPWARPVDITALKGALYIDDTEIHISEEALGNSGARCLPAETVLLTSRATIGETAITTVPMATNQGFANLVCNERLLNIYLVYYLQAIKDLLISLGSGSTFLEVTKGTLVGVRIPLPPLAEQHAIANFLDHKTGQIDELIHIKERRIELLQEQRTALINQAVTKGLNPTVEMKSSGVEWIGEIPKDREVTRLKYICESIVDCEHKTAPTQETGYSLIRTPNIGIGHLMLDGVNRVSEAIYQEWSRRTIPQSGDLILAREAPVGNVAIIPKDLKVCLGQRTVLIRPDKNKVCSMFLVYLMLGDEIQASLLGRSTGATVHHLNMTDIRNLELPRLPSLSTQRKIADFLNRKTKQIDELITTEQRKIELLKEYRQSLISEVVTGKIDVRNEV